MTPYPPPERALTALICRYGAFLFVNSNLLSILPEANHSAQHACQRRDQTDQQTRCRSTAPRDHAHRLEIRPPARSERHRLELILYHAAPARAPDQPQRPRSERKTARIEQIEICWRHYHTPLRNRNATEARY